MAMFEGEYCRISRRIVPKSTVLIVDDDADIRTILATNLKHQNCTVFAVENASTAMVMLQNVYFDLVLLDILLPDDTSDPDLIAQMKALQPRLKVIMLTVADEDDAPDLAFQVGADAYLIKPVSVFQLMHVVDKTLAHGAQ